MSNLEIQILIKNADAHKPIDDVFEDVSEALLELFQDEAEPPVEVELDMEVKE